MNITIDSEFKKFAPIYILWVLETYTDEENRLTYEQIKEKLEESGFVLERKAIARNVQDLCHIGYKIHGAYPEYDEEGNKVKSKRGVWLEKHFSDENLQMLIDSVLFSKYIAPEDAKTLIGHIRDMGSATFQRKNKGIAKVSSVYHAHHVDFFKELGVIQQAIIQERKLTISYGSYTPKNGDFVFEGKNKTVHPYHLAFVKGNYYLIGLSEETGEIEHFRVDRIRQAKMEKGAQKPIQDTSMKGVSLGEYVDSHPYFETGKPTTVTFKVQSDKIGHVVDAFGESFRVYGSDRKTTTLAVKCNENDAYYWALQFGSCVEVIEPQSLRDRLRFAVEEMAMRYLGRDGDRYGEALKNMENNGNLDLTGVKLVGFTKHQSLTKIKVLRLSDNKISDISFVKNYAPFLCVVSLFNNPIADLSPLSACDKVHTLHLKNLAITDLSALTQMKGLRCLELENCEDVDCSAVYQMPNLDCLRIHGIAKNLDVKKLQEMRPSLDVREHIVRERADRIQCICSQFPLNVLKESLGYNILLSGDEKDAIAAVEEVFHRLPIEEREVAELVFKEHLGEAAISERLKISVEEIGRLQSSYMKKFKHKSYQRGLEKFVTVKDPRSTNAMEKLKEMIEKL